MGWFHNTFYDFFDKYKRFAPPTKKEVNALIVTILALTFIVAYNDGNEVFNLAGWVTNFLIWLVIITFSVIWYHAGQRAAAVMANLKVEYSIWWYGLIIGVTISLITRGHWWVIIPGGILVKYLEIQRIGWFRFGVNTYAMSMIALAGPMSAFILAALIKTPELWLGFSLFGADFVQKLFIFNLAYAGWALLPIPPLDGSKIFFHSRLLYAFILGAVVSYGFMAALGIYSYLLAIIIGAGVCFLFYILFEGKAWSKGWQ